MGYHSHNPGLMGGYLPKIKDEMKLLLLSSSASLLLSSQLCCVFWRIDAFLRSYTTHIQKGHNFTAYRSENQKSQ